MKTTVPADKHSVVVTMCLSKFRALLSKTSLSQIQHDTGHEFWDMRNDRWHDISILWKISFVLRSCWFFKRHYIIARVFFTYHKCTAACCLQRLFFYKRPAHWNFKSQVRKNLKTLLDLDKTNSATTSCHDDCWSASSINPKFPDWIWLMVSSSGRPKLQTLLVPAEKKTKEMFFNCWKVSLLETKLSD